MSRVIFITEYEVYVSKIEEYLKKIGELKKHLSTQGYDYKICRDKKKNNYFFEIFTFESEEEFEKFDDFVSDKVNDIIYEINTKLVLNKKVSYKTLVQEEI